MRYESMERGRGAGTRKGRRGMEERWLARIRPTEVCDNREGIEKLFSPLCPGLLSRPFTTRNRSRDCCSLMLASSATPCMCNNSRVSKLWLGCATTRIPHPFCETVSPAHAWNITPPPTSFVSPCSSRYTKRQVVRESASVE